MAGENSHSLRFFFSASTSVSGFLTSYLPVWDMRFSSPENRPPCCSLGPWSRTILPSLYLSESYVCFLYDILGFSWLFLGGVGKSASTPSFPKQKCSPWFSAQRYQDALEALTSASWSSISAVPNLFGTRDWFRVRQFFHGWVGGGDGSGGNVSDGELL